MMWRFMVSRKIRSNVRELHSALTTLKAYYDYTKHPITIITAARALEIAFASHSRAVTVDKIFLAVADYYHLRQSDLTSRNRRQTLVRARHMAMGLCKELTNESVSEIGRHFSRDHTTVLHACKKVIEFRKNMPSFENDYNKLFTQLSD